MDGKRKNGAQRKMKRDVEQDTKQEESETGMIGRETEKNH